MAQQNGVVNSFIWKAGERILVQGVGLLVQVILARLLLPEDFACLAIINAIIGYLGIFVQSGLSIAVVQKKNLTEEDLKTLTGISLLVALILFAALYVLSPFISDYYNVGNITWPIRVMGVSLFLFSFNSIQSGLLMRRMQFRTIFMRSLLATPLSSIVGIVLAYAGCGIWALVAYSVTNILLTVVFMNMIPDLRLKIGFNRESAKELYSFCLKIIGTNLVSSGGDTIRTLTIGKKYNPNQLAFFDRGLTYSSLVTQVVNASLSSVLLPTFSRSQDDYNQLLSVARRSVGLSAFVIFPLLVFVAAAAEPLVGLVLTEKWLPCTIFLSVFCLMRIPGIIASIDKQVFYALGKSQIGLYFEICLLAANLVSLFVLLSKGPLAIAIGFTIVEYIGNIVLFFVASKVYNYSIKKRINDIGLPIINSLILFAVCYGVYYLHLSYIYTILLQLVLGLTVYIMFAYCVHDRNLNILKDIILRLCNK